MPRSKFSLYSSHLDFAHQFWQSHLKPLDLAIDATCGNGHDTLFLTTLIPQGKLYAIDIQNQAIEETKKRLEEHFGSLPSYTKLILGSHGSFPEEILPETVQLIVYNLGYLPGSDKSIKTYSSTTLKSIQNALTLLAPFGAICLTCYSGHPEGLSEEKDLISFLSTLDKETYLYSHTFFSNRPLSPSVVILQKKGNF